VIAQYAVDLTVSQQQLVECLDLRPVGQNKWHSREYWRLLAPPGISRIVIRPGRGSEEIFDHGRFADVHIVSNTAQTYESIPIIATLHRVTPRVNRAPAVRASGHSQIGRVARCSRRSVSHLRRQSQQKAPEIEKSAGTPIKQALQRKCPVCGKARSFNAISE